MGIKKTVKDHIGCIVCQWCLSDIGIEDVSPETVKLHFYGHDGGQCERCEDKGFPTLYEII